MHPKILHKSRIADMLRDEKRAEFWNESTRYQKFAHTEPPTTKTSAQVWDDTRDRVVTCGDVSLRFVDSGGKHHHGLTNVEITCGSKVWSEGYGWITEVHGGRIYHVGHNPTDIRCYILREVNRRPGSQKGNWIWDQPGLPADHPIASQMIADVKRAMDNGEL